MLRNLASIKAGAMSKPPNLFPPKPSGAPHPLEKPRVDGPHMATVLGPPGEEIYCDEWGRVMVSFP